MDNRLTMSVKIPEKSTIREIFKTVEKNQKSFPNYIEYQHTSRIQHE